MYRVAASLFKDKPTSKKKARGRDKSEERILAVLSRIEEVNKRKETSHKAIYQHRVVRSVRSAPALPTLLKPK